MIRTATTAWVAAAPRLATTSTVLREARSATAPPTRRNASNGMLFAASTIARSPVLPEASSTAKASATGAIALPDNDTSWPAKNQRKAVSCHGFRAGSRAAPARGRTPTGPPCTTAQVPESPGPRTYTRRTTCSRYSLRSSGLWSVRGRSGTAPCTGA